MALSKRDLKRIAEEVFSNFESITGVSLEQVTFHQAMDADFVEETVYMVDEWVKEQYPGVDIFGRHGQVLTELDGLFALHT